MSPRTSTSAMLPPWRPLRVRSTARRGMSAARSSGVMARRWSRAAEVSGAARAAKIPQTFQCFGARSWCTKGESVALRPNLKHPRLQGNPIEPGSCRNWPWLMSPRHGAVEPHHIADDLGDRLVVLGLDLLVDLDGGVERAGQRRILDDRNVVLAGDLADAAR